MLGDQRPRREDTKIPLHSQRSTPTQEAAFSLLSYLGKGLVSANYCASQTRCPTRSAMQALLANSCSHQVTAFSASQHQHICNVSQWSVTRFHADWQHRFTLSGMQCAQPSHSRRRSPLGNQHSDTKLTHQGLRSTASNSKRLQISHATPRQSTKDAGHR